MKITELKREFNNKVQRIQERRKNSLKELTATNMKSTQEGAVKIDNGVASVDYHPASKVKQGLFVSRSLGLIIAGIFLIIVLATAFIVYNFAACYHKDLDVIASSTDKLHSCTNSLEITTISHTDPTKSTTSSTIKYDPKNLPPLQEGKLTRPKDVRLPKSVHPTSYDIKLTPYLEEGNFTFDGEVDIKINIDEDCHNVTFHGVDLALKNLTLINDKSKRVINIKKRDEDVSRQYHILHTAEKLNKGEIYSLRISYRGILDDDLRGFYRSSYIINNETRWIAVTQFQPTDARRAFPSFDEPALKAIFTISIARPNRMSSISNMNKIHTEPHEKLKNYTWDHFAPSLPMSTYLVAFAVTDFANKTNGLFTVWARENAIDSASFALEIGPKMLNFCEEFYQIPFPLPKIDMIAVPDFSAGAMENWGLLTFRETAMLYSKFESPVSAQMRVATVIAHELAHQWFGNLVTPSWWTDLWLNEGFATYIEYIAVDAVRKSWKSLEQFVINDIQGVFHLDVLESSHQISVEVSNPEEINEIFDSISYGKGAAIIRMMNHFLTENVFNQGVTDYLKSKQFSSAEQKDLWDSLTKKAREVSSFTDDVGTIMDAWTLQTGFPVVTVTRNYETGTLHFEQERFTLLNGEPSNQTWWIPISYTSAREKEFDDTYPKLWMKGDKNISLANASLNSDDWVVVNIQQTGFYRVNYDIRNWELIIKTLNDPLTLEDIAPINRAQIIDDVMNLAHSGKIDYKIALDVNKYLTFETNYVPWKAGLGSMGFLDSVFSKTPYYLEYKKHALAQLKATIETVGWEAKNSWESMIRIQHRIHLLSAACHLEHPECMAYAVRMYHMWMMHPNPDAINEVPVDMRAAVYCAGLSAGGQREWTFAWERFLRAHVASERDLLLNVLGCTREPYLLYRYLDLAVRNDSSIRKQDVVSVFASLSNSAIGQPIALSFLRRNCRLMKKQFGSTFLNIVVKVVGKRLTTSQELEEVTKLASECQNDLGRSIEQVIEMTQANIKWMEKNLNTIVDWLHNNYS